jgi:anti-sigma factor RsiW
MNMTTNRPDDTRLSAWLDSELPDAERAQVEAWLRDHPEDAARVRLWAADRDALRARFEPLLDEPVPQHLLDLVQKAPTRQAGGWQRWRLAAASAGLLLAGGVLGALLVARVPLGTELARGPAPSWTHRATVAHAVYAPEQRHPVEVNVEEGDSAAQQAQEAHLVKWLSKRLAMPVTLYDLSAQGFRLVGGRLLPDANGPSAQLMYQDAAGARVTMYLRKPEPGTETAFRYQRQGELGMFYWVEEGYGCALVGALPRERLLALADAVYKQSELDGTAPPPR